MKIYKKVKIDIETGETLYEDSYEYDGEIAECKGGGGVEYSMSPEQRQALGVVMPYFQKMFSGGGQPWEIPSTQSMMPQQGWYEGLDQNIRAGVMEPYQDASKQLTESLGYSAGSARGGASGSLWDTQKDFWTDATPQITQSAWDMVNPAQQMGWQAELGRNQFLPQSATSMMGGGQLFPSPVVSQPSSKGSSTMGMLGTIGAGALSNTALFSDIRLKKNINKIGKYKGMDIIEFEYIWGGGRQVGLIAQQVKGVIPNAVGETKEGYLYINYALI